MQYCVTMLGIQFAWNSHLIEADCFRAQLLWNVKHWGSQEVLSAAIAFNGKIPYARY